MQLSYILELLKPIKRKENIFLNNIVEVVKNQNIREVKALYKLFLKSGSEKDNIEFKSN